jgi:hypothetical protein
METPRASPFKSSARAPVSQMMGSAARTGATKVESMRKRKSALVVHREIVLLIIK